MQNRDTSYANGDAQNPSKKRKLHASQGVAVGDAADRIMFEAWKQSSWGALPDISFSIPQRKKLCMEIGLLPEQGLRARNVASDEIELAVRWKDIGKLMKNKKSPLNQIHEGLRHYAGGYVEHVTCLPVPEKAQAQYMFCVFPFNADGINNHSSKDNEPAEQILWAVPNTALKPSQVSGELAIETEDTYRSLLLRVLNRCLAPFQKQVEVPNEKDFASKTAQVYRKGEKAVHVKAFRGSKDGRYRFLILWNEIRRCNLVNRFDPNPNIYICLRAKIRQ